MEEGGIFSDAFLLAAAQSLLSEDCSTYQGRSGKGRRRGRFKRILGRLKNQKLHFGCLADYAARLQR